MFKSHLRPTVHVALKICLALGLFLLPLAASAAPTYAQANAVPTSEAGKQDKNVVILKEVQNPDGTKTVTMRIYAAPNGPNAPDTNFWMSQDTYITSGIPDGNYGSVADLRIGYSSSDGQGAMRMLMQFNLSSIPSNATVNSAIVYIYQYYATGISSMGFQAQYAVSPWNEYNATWNNANYIGGSPLPVGNFPSTLGWLSINSTNLFRTWVSGAEPNYGLIITGNEDPVTNSSRRFYSNNSGARPYVDINYTVGCSYTTPPTSYVNALPPTSPTAFTVSWTGAAYTPPGCAANGISSYVVWYQVNNGDFIKWLDGVSYTSAQFNAANLGIANGSVVGFRSQAIDYYGNKTPAGNATASTVINAADTTPPSTTMNPLPQYTTSTSFWVSWTGSDSGSGVAYYNLQYQLNQGAWQTLISYTPQTSFYVQNAQTGVYGFRVQAVDYAGNVQAWPGSAQASTTVIVNPLAVVQPFSPPILQSTAPVTKSFTVSWKSYTPPGTYLTTVTIRYRYDTGSGWTTWALWPLSPFPASKTDEDFNWFAMGLPDEAKYQFQATAANNLNQPPYELPSQYWPIMFVDMHDRGSITYLPLIFNNAP